MTTTGRVYPVHDTEKFKRQMLNWVQPFSIFCVLDNNNYREGHHSLECLLAAGAVRQISSDTGASLNDLQQFIDEKPSWLFGHLGYDLKNEIAPLFSSHPDHIGFPDLFFFEPEITVRLQQQQLTIEADDPDEIFRAISTTPAGVTVTHSREIKIRERIAKPDYLAIIRQLQQHILRGDCYEINFCQEFFSENVSITPAEVYRDLAGMSPNPFAALYRVQDRYLICASPERFLQKTGHHILSQPIKGTRKRSPADALADAQNKSALYSSAKDRSENVMVVDLVRNDLAKICREGTVAVDELYGVYPFPQVFQMISTVSGELRDHTSFTDIIRATFPMGSMTGAPKRSVMQLIEQYEQTKRGIFSGALGYMTPAGDFDFNVVIRSILYNAATAYLSFPAGSGITFYSDAESEWEECMLKAAAIRKVLTRQ